MLSLHGSTLQIMSHLKPGNWSNDKTEREIQALMNDEIKAGVADFELYRYNYVSEIFDYLQKSSIVMERSVVNEIEKLQSSAE